MLKIFIKTVVFIVSFLFVFIACSDNSKVYNSILIQMNQSVELNEEVDIRVRLHYAEDIEVFLIESQSKENNEFETRNIELIENISADKFTYTSDSIYKDYPFSYDLKYTFNSLPDSTNAFRGISAEGETTIFRIPVTFVTE